MRVAVNGREQEIESAITIAALLAALDLAPERTVVELNREIVTHDAYGVTRLRDGDALELVEIVGGG